MKEKIKVLFPRLEKKSPKPKKIPMGGVMRLEDFIEKSAPDMYEFIYANVEEEDIVKQAEIVLITHIESKSMRNLELLKKVKQLNPLASVFILNVDDEQETIDEYMAAGAYKCYLQPLMIPTLAHDMYVALNLE